MRSRRNNFINKEIDVYRDGLKIYGKAYLPEEGKKYPLVIIAHGLATTHRSVDDYAEDLLKLGVATYIFDFNGGASRNKSEGKTTDMSLMTEAQDLLAIVKEAKHWDFVDEDKIVLMGESQGGAASAMAASMNSDDVNGLILLYPAFLIPDTVHSMFDTKGHIRDTFSVEGWIKVGRNYATDVWDLDLYQEIAKYKKKVLILHGDRDGIVNISYAKRAHSAYADSDFYIIRGQGHGFYGKGYQESLKYIEEYLQKINII